MQKIRTEWQLIRYTEQVKPIRFQVPSDAALSPSFLYERLVDVAVAEASVDGDPKAGEKGPASPGPVSAGLPRN